MVLGCPDTLFLALRGATPHISIFPGSFMTDRSALFNCLSSALNLDESTRLSALQLFEAYNKAEAPQSSDSAMDYLLRCAILAASRLTVTPTLEGTEVCGSALSLSQVLRDLPDLDTAAFMQHLKKFLERVPLPESVRKDLSDIKAAFTFSHTFFKKFEELWNQLVPGSGPAKQIAWLLYILCKARVLRRRTEIVENVLTLLGSIHFVLLRTPESTTLTGTSSEKMVQCLCDLLKTQPKYAQPYVDRVLEEVRTLISARVLQPGTDLDQLTDLFARSDKATDILRSLTQAYGESLTPADIDERDFLLTSMRLKILTPRKQRVQMTPFAKQIDSSQKLISQRLLRWDANAESVSLQSKMQEVKLQPGTPIRSAVAAVTPMTQAMEMNNWLTSLTDTMETVALSDTLIEYCSRCEPNAKAEIETLIGAMKEALEVLCRLHDIGSEAVGTGSGLQSCNPKVSLILKLYLQLLELMLQSEGRKNSTANFSAILHSACFHRSLLASCFESVLFLHNICSVAFEEVLQTCQISGFDFWKIITTFCNVDPRMPIPLKTHFRVIEVRIITSLGWVTSSPVHETLRLLAEKARATIAEDSGENEDSESPADSQPELHVTYDLFFRRVLSFTAYRVLTMTEELALPGLLQEDIWAAMKFFLSEKTELLRDRHLDQLILCAVFGVCKARSHPLKFASLLQIYANLNPDEALSVTRQVRLDSGEGSIIDLYNSTMVPHIRDFTSGHRRSNSARILSFSPTSSLRSTISPQFLQSPSMGRSPYRSPYMTPMTQRLFAVPESPTVRSSDKLIDFDNEERKYEPRPKATQLELPSFKS